MYFPKEDREHATSFSDLLDYFALLEDGIGFLKSGVFLAAWEFEGWEATSRTLAERFHLANRIANGMDLGADFGVSCDVFRIPAKGYLAPPGSWESPIAHLLDEERRAQFGIEGNYYSNRQFFCLTYRPLVANERATSWFFHTDAENQGFADQCLERFRRARDRFESLLGGNMREARRLRCYEDPATGDVYDDLHRYFQFCLFGEDRPFLLPEGKPVGLNGLLGAPFVGGHWPRIDEKYHAAVVINQFPKHSFAGIFDRLFALPFPYRFSQQAEILGAQQAASLYSKLAKYWHFKKTKAWQRFKDKNAPIANPKAAELEKEAELAAQAAEYGDAVDVYYTSKIVLAHEDLGVLRARIKEVNDALPSFRVRHEHHNATAAVIASLPGHMHRDQRQNLITTQNLAHFLPLGSPWRGAEYNPSPYFPPQTPPLLLGVTTGRSPVRLHLHVGDVGHPFVTGPSGTGKTTLLGLTAVQWLYRYRNSRVVSFDKKKSLSVLCRAVAGNFIDIAPGQSTFCPLAHLETDFDLAWASHYLAFLCGLNGLSVSSRQSGSIDRAVTKLLFSTQRSLTDLLMLVDDEEVKNALRYFTIASTAGGILDGTVQDDQIRLARWTVFETDELYKLDPRQVNGVFFYLFHLIERMASTSTPTLVTVDEFREALEHPIAAKRFGDLLQEGRARNMAVMTVMQDLGRVLQSPLRAPILGSCPTKIYLANPNAALGEEALAYREFGNNETDLHAIANLQPKAEYYWTTPDVKQTISLHCGKAFLAFLSASEADRETVDRLRARNPLRWQADWLRHKGLEAHGWATFAERLLLEEERYAAVSA